MNRASDSHVFGNSTETAGKIEEADPEIPEENR
jgi:hypothetical protein